jgi:enoyl-CoA hydratase/carnithine racemase
MSLDPKTLEPTHFRWVFERGVGTITLDRPERKNPLTFDSYAELRDLFRALASTPDVRVVILAGAGGNFCSGGDVHEIIGPLTKMDLGGLQDFTRMTGDLVRAMRACPQPIVAAVDGVCAGAGAILAMASDLRLAAPDARRPSFLPASASAAPTWGPAPYCRGSSATVEPRNCCSPAAA